MAVAFGGGAPFACMVPAGCGFHHELFMTPVLVRISSNISHISNPGETLSLHGHGLSTTAADNTVTVGGEPCIVTGAAQDNSYSAPACPVGACSAARDLIAIECTLPPHHAFAPHAVRVDVAGYGAAPALAAATVSYSVRLASVSPASGSLGGGTTLTLTGDGLSLLPSDAAVMIDGVRCRVVTAAYTQITCVTGGHTTAASYALLLSVRGVSAVCVGTCSYEYSVASTPTVASAVWTSNDAAGSSWGLALGGSGFGPAPVVKVGDTACSSISSLSDTALQCTLTPPMGGLQTVTLYRADWGWATGAQQVTGAALSVSGLAPVSMGAGGGADLVISGLGFASASSSRVTVCGAPCAVTAASATSLTCTAPSRLVHSTGLTTTKLRVTSEASLDSSAGYAAMGSEHLNASLMLRSTGVVGLQFGGLTSTNLPRGARVRKANLRIVPHADSRQGSVALDVRASISCAADPPPLSAAALAAANSTVVARTAWDVRPWTLGFPTDESPDLASLIAPLVAADVENCSLVLTLVVTEATGTLGQNGARAFNSLGGVAGVAELHIDFEPPTTSEQLEWAADADACAVAVSVPTAFEADDGGACTRFDAAAAVAVVDRNPCPHLRLEAIAYTHGGACKLLANGIDLLGACGADRSAAYLAGGVCAASMVTSGGAEPRTACFDTTVAGQGTDQLAAWVEALPLGSAVMLATCGRLAWPHNRPNISSALGAALGAQSTISDISDAYALVGVRAVSVASVSAAALAESHLPCCVLAPGESSCATCAQNRTSAVAELACGAAASATEDTLTMALKRAERVAEVAALRSKSDASKALLGMEPTDWSKFEDMEPPAKFGAGYGFFGGGLSVTLDEEAVSSPPPPPPPAQFVGTFGSPAHVAALAALPQSVHAAPPPPSAVVDASTAFDAVQRSDNDPLDAACDASGLVGGDRFGARLATDGANASYWLSVGRDDALLDVPLASTTLVHELKLCWEFPARDVLVLYSPDASGDGWLGLGLGVGLDPNPNPNPYLPLLPRRLR